MDSNEEDHQMFPMGCWRTDSEFIRIINTSIQLFRNCHYERAFSASEAISSMQGDCFAKERLAVTLRIK